MEPTQPTQSTQESERHGVSANTTKVLFLLVVLLVVVLIALKVAGPGDEKVETTPGITQENVENERAQGTVPAGFPQDMPVEEGEIVESIRSNYVDRGVIAYSVIYLSDISPAEKYTQYLRYMNDAGYQFGPQGRNEEQGMLSGTNSDGDDLSVLISLENNRTRVQISYLERQ